MIVEGILINILNPKLSIFFFAFLPQFVDTTDPNALPTMLELSGVFMAMTFVVFAIYGVFAAAVRDIVATTPGAHVDAAQLRGSVRPARRQAGSDRTLTPPRSRDGRLLASANRDSQRWIVSDDCAPKHGHVSGVTGS